jgi:hypothetical protein
MYACVLEAGRGFFEGVCALRDLACISTDPPLPCHSRIASCLYCLRLSRFLPLTTVNLYSFLQYLVLAKSRKEWQLALLRPDRGEAMQDSGYGLLRISLLGTALNKDDYVRFRFLVNDDHALAKPGR